LQKRCDPQPAAHQVVKGGLAQHHDGLLIDHVLAGNQLQEGGFACGRTQQVRRP
jgi:hypothetical protein